MPRIIMEVNGQMNRCDSNDLVTIGRWLSETLRRYFPGGDFTPADYCVLRLDPLHALVDGNWRPDWIEDGSQWSFTLNRGGMRQLNQLLQEAGIDTGLVNDGKEGRGN